MWQVIKVTCYQVVIIKKLQPTKLLYQECLKLPSGNLWRLQASSWVKEYIIKVMGYHFVTKRKYYKLPNGDIKGSLTMGTIEVTKNKSCMLPFIT